MSSGVKNIKVLNEDIQSNLTKVYRNAKNYHIFRDSQTTSVTNKAMVSHTSLAEVSMWTRYMDFK